MMSLRKAKSPPLESQGGMSLVELTMAAGAIGGILLLVLSLLEVQQKGIRSNRLMASRDTLKMNLDRILGTPEQISKSALYRDGGVGDESNRILDYCLRGTQSSGPPPSACAGDPVKCCVETPSGTWTSFNLSDPASPNPRDLIAGTEATPIRFDDEGTRCRPGADPSKCPIEVVARFAAKCAGGESPCERAASLVLNYEIRQTPASRTNGKPLLAARTHSHMGLAVSIGQVARYLTAPSGTPTSPGGDSSGDSGSAGGAMPGMPDNFRRVIYLPDSPSQTFTVPDGVNTVIVTLIGGGGGGGGGSGAYSTGSRASARAGSGGASSCVRLKNLVWVSPGDAIPITVGRGGSGGAGGAPERDGNYGGEGGASRFGNYLSISGGTRGKYGHKCLSAASCPNSGTPAPSCTALSGPELFAGPIITSQLISGLSGAGFDVRTGGSGGASVLPNIDGVNNFGQGGRGGDSPGNSSTPGPGSSGAPGADGAVIVEYVLPKGAS